MKRIVVVGTSGAGKTTVARRLACGLALPLVELDAIFHQPGWSPLDADVFRARTEARLDDALGWVVDGNYNDLIGTTLQRRADTIVWLDPPRGVVMRQVAARTLRRAVLRQELWNGNREPLSNFWRWDPERNIVRWAWVTFHENRERYEVRARDGTWAHARVVRLRSRREIRAFLHDG